MGTSCRVRGAVPNGPQGFTRGEEPRPDCSNRDIKYGGEFRVGLAFDFAQPEQRSLLGA